LYPARAPASNTTKYMDLLKINPNAQPGDDRSGYIQGAYQFGGIAVTFLLALIGGVLSGKRLNCKKLKMSVLST